MCSGASVGKPFPPHLSPAAEVAPMLLDTLLGHNQ